jgi:thymidylate synthase ThyX
MSPLVNYMEPQVSLMTESDAYKKLELCGRNCYKSEEKIGPGTAEKLLKQIIARGHESVLEHFRICMTLSQPTAVLLAAWNRHLRLYDSNDVIVAFTNKDIRGIELRGNIRAFRDVFKLLVVADCQTRFYPTRMNITKPGSKLMANMALLSMSGNSINQATHDELYNLINTLGERWPVLFLDIADTYNRVNPWGRPERIKASEFHIDEDPDYMTFRIITDRGVTHEAVRHREDMSFSQESTRYCTYGGNNALNVILPVPEKFEQANPTTQVRAIDLWKDHMENCASVYQSLLECGLPAQYARSILPNSLKTDIIMTAPNDTWCAFYKLRSGSGAHPQIREPVAHQIAALALSEKNVDLEDYIDVDDLFTMTVKSLAAPALVTPTATP